MSQWLRFSFASSLVGTSVCFRSCTLFVGPHVRLVCHMFVFAFCDFLVLFVTACRVVRCVATWPLLP